MENTISPTNEIPTMEQTLATQEDAPAQQEEQPVVQDTVASEEIEEELIIEDFTIDGICGVY